ncbi:hypothetical protein AYO41_01820 [Verrucomicrobia bacterium SCGC AG-212-E04]|nr:hypothetical protein AYO41_01820 [Verrucomicrobia bacterium SCGC AG-212-E04]
MSAVAITALLLGEALACGLEGDETTVRRFALDYEYPDALQVLGAVSDARVNGRLDRALWINVATLSPDERQAVMLRIRGGLWKLRARLANGAPAHPPPLSIVLLQPMLWSRIAFEDESLKLTVHIDRPAPGDVVVVTEEAVLAAINSGALSAGDADASGLMRFYGGAPEVAAVRAWFQATDAR